MTALFTVAGLLVLLFVAYDVYATILDAIGRAGPISGLLNRGVWGCSTSVGLPLLASTQASSAQPRRADDEQQEINDNEGGHQHRPDEVEQTMPALTREAEGQQTCCTPDRRDSTIH